jgi:quinol monooxygenase YgiN
MVRIVWEFMARADKIKEFENHFADPGPWTALFRKNSGHHGTVLLRDLQTPRRYLTIDRWESAALHRAKRATHRGIRRGSRGVKDKCPTK